MSSVSTTPSDETISAQKDSLRKLRLNFWTKRLDHTLEHTQTSSQLIYIVDGAILALLAFIVEKLRISRQEAIFLAIPIFFLALLNYYHSQIIMRQREWYNAIDKRIREVLDNEPEIRFKSDIALGSTHHIYSRMHKAIAVFLILAALFIVVYSFV